MRAIYFLLLFVFFCSSAFAQNSRIWATYYGSLGFEEALSVATDDSGNVYIAGKTTSDSAIAFGGFQNVYGGGASDAFLVKFDGAGNRIWATYYGGAGAEEWSTVDLDDSGYVYLAGSTTSASGISTFNGFQDTLRGTEDAFLVKFDENGNRIWATYYGGMASDEGLFVRTDRSDNIYLGGMTNSNDGIAFNGHQNTNALFYDAFLVKFDGSCNRIWGTYYGGPSFEYGVYGIATDDVGNVYITGLTGSASGIASGGHQNTYGGGSWDGYLVKFNENGLRLWSTYYGGSGDDAGVSVTTHSGSIYLAGFTASDSNIAFNGYQNTYSGGTYDDFLVKFDSGGTRTWATYFGGPGTEDCYSLATDTLGNIYLAGYTSSNMYISYAGFKNGYGGGANDAFLAKFDPAGNRFCSTYWGGSGGDRGLCVAVDMNGDLYLSGRTYSFNAIAYFGFQNTYGGGSQDAFLVKLGSCLNTGMEIVFYEEGITVYPNPSDGVFTIDTKTILGEIEIYNVLGENVYQTEVKGNGSIVIDLHDKPGGIYLIRVRDGNEIEASGKIILSN